MREIISIDKDFLNNKGRKEGGGEGKEWRKDGGMDEWIG